MKGLTVEGRESGIPTYSGEVIIITTDSYAQLLENGELSVVDVLQVRNRIGFEIEKWLVPILAIKSHQETLSE
jgi:hypothetical protein